MNKNVKRMFFVLTLVILFTTAGAVCAADDTNSTNTASDSSVSDATISDSMATTSTQTIDTNINTKTIEKEEKNLKTEPKTVEVNNFAEITSTINSAINDAENDEYIINLNEGTYQITSNINYNKGSYTPHITINANNQSLTADRVTRRLTINNGCNITINNASINMNLLNYNNLTLNNVNILNNITNYANANLTLNNTTFNSTLTNNEVTLVNNGILESTCIIINNKELTLDNVTLENKIANNNKLIISADCNITDNFKLRENGETITNITLPENALNTTKVVEVNSATELTNEMKNAAQDAIYSLYIINLNEGTYQFVGPTRTWTYRPNIIINGNNQILNGTYVTSFVNAGNNTLNQAYLNTPINIGGTGTNANTALTTLTLNQVIISNTTTIYANGQLTLNNCTVSSKIDNRGKLIISEDTIFDSNADLVSTGTITTENNNILYPYQNTFNGGYLKDIIIDKDIITTGNFTLKNVTVDQKITNNGQLTIDDDVTFTENGQIIGSGEIITNNITKILPYIQTINGNYTITDTTLDKTYKFMGNITLDNCNITGTDNINYGILNINNSNIITEDENIWIKNYGLIIINNSNTTGNITNNGELYIDNLPEDYTYNNTYHVINNDTISLFFDSNNEYKLNDKVKEADTLDFQGTISGIPGLNSITINKPVNIITSTNDGRIERFSRMTYDTGASGSNVTGLYLYNTQFYVRNAHNIVFNNISNVVNSASVGGGVGQTSIRDNSTNIVVNNSFLYTKDNGGSTSIALTYASNCTIENTIIQGEGNVGNIFYLNTYNPTITTPEGNCYNIIRNNTLYGPERATGICWAISVNGHDNLFENNKIYYVGTGVTTAYGGSAYNNTFIGTEFHMGSGFSGVPESTIINSTAYDNGLITVGANSKAFNNTGRMTVSGANSIVSENNITTLTVSGSNNIIENNTIDSISVTGANAIINNNTINSGTMNANNVLSFTNNNITTININRALNITNNNINNIVLNSHYNNLTYNNITNTLILRMSNTQVQYNNITTNDTYTITGTGTNNIITDNYLRTPEKYGDNSVDLNPETNTIANNTPIKQLIITTTTFTPGQTAIITASIYLEDEIITNITSGKVALKVNEKLLKDTNGKVIYAKVVNGTATIENYVVPDDWAKDGTTIQAVYSGSTQCEKLTSEKTEITLTTPEPTLTITPITNDIPKGSNITLKAKIAAGDEAITTGKIVFKINGKTVKDANGKVIYAQVDANGEVSVDYNLGNLKAGTYTIEAIFMAPNYDKITSNTTMTVVKA